MRLDDDLRAMLEQERARMNGNGANGPNEPFALDVMAAPELCALPDPSAADELLGPLLMRGNRLVLGGGTGEGKSTMTLQLVRAVVTGGEFLDWQGSGG